MFKGTNAKKNNKSIYCSKTPWNYMKQNCFPDIVHDY